MKGLGCSLNILLVTALVSPPSGAQQVANNFAESLAVGNLEAKPQQAKYPRVEFVRSGQAKKGGNKALVQNFKDAEKPLDLKKNDIFTEHAKIVTTTDAEVKIEVDPYTQLIIFENTTVEIPVITWGQGEIQDINLIQGRIQVSCEKNCARNYSTPISKNAFGNGVFVLHYKAEVPSVELTTLHGEQDFRGLENENVIHLKAGQRVVFQGLIENEQVAYDVLLKGRKVARGQMGPIATVPSEELEALEVRSKKLKPIEIVKPKAPPRTPSQICDAPYGELNQCAWTCEGLSSKKKLKTCDLSQSGVHCVRRRCNANGQWGDATVLNQNANRCERQPVVAGCDY